MNAASITKPYLRPLSDECFFSLCSRQHIFWGSGLYNETLTSLFGDSAKAYSHDFPRCLSLLNDDAKLIWGNTDEIIQRYTIAPLFFPFQSPNHIQELKKAMESPRLGSVKYKLGVITGRFGGEHPLKACIMCMDADRKLHGVTYWHLSHQFPGVTTCPVHGRLLIESKKNRQWSRGFQWLLPEEHILAKTVKPEPDAPVIEALQNISTNILALAKLGSSFNFEPGIVAQVYKDAITNLNLFEHPAEGAGDNFAAYCSLLQPYPPFMSLPCSRQSALSFICQMTRKPRGYFHPLKHLTFILWLFHGIDPFIEAYEHLMVRSIRFKVGKLRTPIKLEANAGLPSKVSPSRQTLKPKKIFGELKTKILNSLANGTPKKAIATEYNVSLSSINRLLRRDASAKERRAVKIQDMSREYRRNKWSTIVQTNPSASVKIIRQLIPSIYVWLYRNDRSWLDNQISKLPRGRVGNFVEIDWNKRDENLCALIERTLSSVSTNYETLQKSDLYYLIPNLFSALEKKSRYPKTRKLLSKIC
ncbi:TnsD family Tn7-like transposition protein [Pseudomonas soli]|uniref:TnsD family Tn7-like transposition protein n=1 Tax=Pseudomonas soli TaxID=1306993 RepID=UPI0009DEF1B7